MRPGPVGRTLRVALGSFLLSLFLLQLSLSLSLGRRSNVVDPLLGGPLGVYMIVSVIYARERNGVIPAVVFGAISALVFVLDFQLWRTAFSPASWLLSFGFWGLGGLTNLVAGLRGYGGCEVAAIANLVGGESSEPPCVLWDRVDRWESKRRDKGD